MSKKQKVIFYGNCQLEGICTRLNHNRQFEEKYELVRCRRRRSNFYVANWRRSDGTKLLKNIASADLFIHQSVGSSVLGEELSSENLKSKHGGHNIWVSNCWFRGYTPENHKLKGGYCMDLLVYYLYVQGNTKKQILKWLTENDSVDARKFAEKVAEVDMKEMHRREAEQSKNGVDIVSCNEIFSEWKTNRLIMSTQHPTNYYYFILYNKLLGKLELDPVATTWYFKKFQDSKDIHPRWFEHFYMRQMCENIDFNIDIPNTYGDYPNYQFKTLRDYVDFWYKQYTESDYDYEGEYKNHLVNQYLPL